MTSTTERCAGGVLVREGEAGREVCLIATRAATRWQLPKGHIVTGESEPDAARREVREETGCHGDIVGDLGEIAFWFFASGRPARRVQKTVHFYLLRYTSGEVRDHDAEVDEARFVSVAEAERRLTFASERQVLETALRQLGEPAPACKADPAA
jgi:8-oxo-dGTP pyrophosphatase MutT (NUDIX family)